MRIVIAGALFASLLLSASAFAAPFAAPAEDIASAAVMPDTPSGEGNPNTIVCRAPQQLPGSAQFGPKRCGYNYEWWQLTAHGKDLAPDGVTVIDRPMVASPRPKGHGNPDAVTCRKPMSLPEPGLNFGPEVCQTNRFWADLIRKGQKVNAEGIVGPDAWYSAYVPAPTSNY
jgi:hypothetical protein